MSSQLDSLSFIREGSTKRKEIFAKFLDLELFDRKFKFAKTEASNLRGALKRLEGKEFAADIDTALYELQQCILDHDNKQAEIADANTKLQEYTDVIRKLDTTIASTPTELIDIVKLRRDLTD